MEFILILVIFILMYLLNSNSESFVNNTFSHLTLLRDNLNPFDKPISQPAPQIFIKEIMPNNLPEEISNHKYMGRLESNYYNSPTKVYLYGLPLEDVQKLYSHLVVYVDEDKISETITLPIRPKIDNGESMWIRDGNHFAGPYVLV
jgi:hypothetical protein